MRRSNIKRLESIANNLSIQAERLYKVYEDEGGTIKTKDCFYLNESYNDIIYMAGAIKRIAKVAREDTDDEV